MTFSPTLSLQDRVVVVTGAAGILCTSINEALLAAGAKVALLGRTKDKLEKTAADLAAKGYTETLVVAADVLDKASLLAAKDVILTKWGKITHLINGAGGNNPKGTAQVEVMEKDTDFSKSFFGLEVEGFTAVFDLNFKGTLLPSMVFGEGMVKSGFGNIINVSSMSALLPLTKVAAYSAAKASVDNFTKWLAVHFSKVGVRVNAISPGFFVTEQNRFLLYEKDAKTLTARGQKIINNTPMNRFGKAEELQGAVLYLASELSAFTTGVVLPIDGGFSAYAGV
jgi:NAD(P)-dependent dehydrogenase (short-subunit alcohol dehydrogenase family)